MDQLADSLQREILGLHRNQQPIRGHQGVQRQQIQRWRAIQHHKIVAIPDFLQSLAQLIGSAVHLDQLDIRAGQVLVRGNQGQRVDLGPQRDFVDGRLAHQHVIRRAPVRIAGNTQSPARVGLRIAVDEQDLQPLQSQCCRKINGGGRFAHPAFLIDYGEHFPHDREAYRHRAPSATRNGCEEQGTICGRFLGRSHSAQSNPCCLREIQDSVDCYRSVDEREARVENSASFCEINLRRNPRAPQMFHVEHA